MDTPAILIKITGAALFLWTLRSIYKHVKDKRAKRSEKKAGQAVSEQFLNGVLLYVWLMFMTAFSLGMVFNN
jgi:hypothetical protein